MAISSQPTAAVAPQPLEDGAPTQVDSTDAVTDGADGADGGTLVETLAAPAAHTGAPVLTRAWQ